MQAVLAELARALLEQERRLEQQSASAAATRMVPLGQLRSANCNAEQLRAIVAWAQRRDLFAVRRSHERGRSLAFCGLAEMRAWERALRAPVRD